MGTREPRKNLSGAIQGFAAAVRLGIDPETSLVLAGPTGWGDDPVQVLIDRLDLGGRVALPGFVAESSKAALLTGASAFLFPSLGEGFGLPALEAMACGVPVVASDRPSLPEVVGDAGLLVDPEDHDALGSQLARVLTEPGLSDELGRRGSSRAASFTWERTAAETAAVYREVLGT
jgi:alpha-1,3-rhamnosyl/mannosyltransferase